MNEDPFQILADELTLIRKNMDRIQRTSLDKNEAEALHQILIRAVADMQRATKEAPKTLQNVLKADRDQMAHAATVAATSAAQNAVKGIRTELTTEHARLSQSASEARRAALRFTGGIWTLLAAVLITGLFLGLLSANVAETGKTLLTIDQMVRFGCGKPLIGGQLIEREDGSSYCVTWIVTPELAEYRRRQDTGS